MFNDMEIYAKINGVPIMMKDGIDYLCNFIKEHNIKNILEIGTAIGYSAIRMASVSDDIYVTTIERDIVRYNEAINNINKYNLGDRIKVILGDASDVLIDGNFDLLFIDASKGHNTEFFQKYSVNVNRDGYIVTDNLNFHGLVLDESLAVTRNQRGIVRKIKLFKEFLDNNKEFKTDYLDIGDGISVSYRI